MCQKKDNVFYSVFFLFKLFFCILLILQLFLLTYLFYLSCLSIFLSTTMTIIIFGIKMSVTTILLNLKIKCQQKFPNTKKIKIFHTNNSLCLLYIDLIYFSFIYISRKKNTIAQKSHIFLIKTIFF